MGVVVSHLSKGGTGRATISLKARRSYYELKSCEEVLLVGRIGSERELLLAEKLGSYLL